MRENLKLSKRGYENLAGNLENLRMFHNLSVAQVSKDLGIASSTLRNYETGRHGISRDRLEKFADYYELDDPMLLVRNWEEISKKYPPYY